MSPSDNSPFRTSRSSRSRSKSSSSRSSHRDTCPFCEISAAYPARLSSQIRYDVPSPTSRPGQQLSFPILSTPQVIAFLDIMPLTPGHILLSPRHHAEKIMDLTPEEGAALGAWLPILTRAVSRAMQVDDLNVVQNNGVDAPLLLSSSSPQSSSHLSPSHSHDGFNAGSVVEKFKGMVEEIFTGARASQVIPHVHYHIIPRPESYTPNRSWTMFGKGPRDEIDEDEAALTAARIRQEIAWELETRGHSEDAVVHTRLQMPISKL